MGIQHKVLRVGSHVSKISGYRNAHAYTHTHTHTHTGSDWISFTFVSSGWSVDLCLFKNQRHCRCRITLGFTPSLLLKFKWASSAWNIWASVCQRTWGQIEKWEIVEEHKIIKSNSINQQAIYYYLSFLSQVKNRGYLSLCSISTSCSLHLCRLSS